MKAPTERRESAQRPKEKHQHHLRHTSFSGVATMRRTQAIRPHARARAVRTVRFFVPPALPRAKPAFHHHCLSSEHFLRSTASYGCASLFLGWSSPTLVGAIWNPFSPGQLLSFSGDGTARVLDVNSPGPGAGVVVSCDGSCRRLLSVSLRRGQFTEGVSSPIGQAHPEPA